MANVRNVLSLRICDFEIVSNFGFQYSGFDKVMSIELQLKNRIMRRVRFIYWFRKATSPIATQTYVLSFFVVQLLRVVSMPHVVANMPSVLDPAAFVEFHAASFLNTEPAVQILAVGVLSLAIWLTRNVIRDVKNVARSAHSYSAQQA